jgi:hypothetical protein
MVFSHMLPPTSFDITWLPAEPEGVPEAPVLAK